MANKDELSREIGLGKPGLPPAVVREFAGQLFEATLRFTSEADHPEIAAQFVEALDRLEASIKPMQEGEMLLAPDAAIRVMREMAKNAAREAFGDD